MRATISTVAFMMLIGCGGRTVLDDPNDELPLPDGGHVSHPTEPEDSGTPPEDAGKPGKQACGTSTCDTATQDCCGTASGMSAMASCVPKGTCTGATVSCQSKSDCSSGDICCGTLVGGFASVLSGGTPDVMIDCAKSCAGGGFQICSGDSECGKGVTCQAIPIGGIKLCGGIAAVIGDAGFGGLGGLGAGAIP
jgi:hypothetical protein